MSVSELPPTQRATTNKSFFSRETSVSADIAAPVETVWQLLTNAELMTSWNSTIVSLTGNIASGERIQLVSTLDPKRTFKLKVKSFEPPSRLTWGDAMGTRTFTLVPNSQDGTRFTMGEKIGGPLFPLFSKMIPPFDESFDQFVADLTKTAEEKNT